MEQPQSLIVFLAEIEDTRKPKGKRHEQLSILTIMIMAMLCGKVSLKSIARFAKTHRAELAKHMPLPRGKEPSYSTIQRASLCLKINDVCSAFNKWMSQHMKPEPTAVDGKSITSTVNTETGKQAFTSLVSFFGQKSQLIYQIGVLENDKRSDVVQEILKVMQIEKSIFTLDALHCQKKRPRRLLRQAMAMSSPQR
jgi:hypothetical protein